MLWLTLTALASPPPPGSAAIVGGEIVEHSDLAAVAALYSGVAYSCAGVLIRPDLILTAGHCQNNPLTHAFLNTIDVDEPGERVEIERAIIYPDHLNDLDLALLLLVDDATVPPVDMAYDCRLDALVDGSPALITGFGANNRFGTRVDGLLREANLPIVDTDCDNPTSGCNVNAMPAGELIAGGDGVDSCNDDSGGPLFFVVEDQLFLLGITSRAALPTNRPCGDGGIYTRIDAAQSWIETEGDFTFETITCGDLPPVNHPPVLSVQSITLFPGQTANVPLTQTDPDNDALTLTVASAPHIGTVVIEEGEARYTAPEGVVGNTRFSLRLTDDGTPNLSVVRVVPVLVHDDTSVVQLPEGCGCATSSPPQFSLLLLPLIALLRRRTTSAA